MKRKPFLTVFLCSVFAALTVLFFAPMEIVLANAGEFFFPFSSVWWFQLLLALAVSLLAAILLCLFPARVGLLLGACVLGVGLAAYAQTFPFMNGLMPSLTGRAIDISASGVAWNLVIWIIIILVAFLAVFFTVKKHRHAVETALCAVAGIFIAMQLVGLITSVVNSSSAPAEKRQDHVLSAQGQFELGSDENVIVFVMDTADGVWARQMLERWPELKDTLSGWTWYPNATSRYNRTYPSLPYMLTAQPCRFDRPVPVYVDEAFTGGMAFLKGLSDAGVDTRILTSEPNLISDLADPYIANTVRYDYAAFGNLYLPGLEKALLRIAVYKCAPYLLKNYGLYDMDYVNSVSFEIHNNPETKYSSYDYEFNDKLKKGLTVSDRYSKAFRFYHTAGTHIGVFWDENLVPDPNRVGHEDYPAAMRGCFRNVEKYIAHLKDLDLYDRATIIVTADHGSNFGVPWGQPLERTTTATPVLMVKYPGADLSQPLQENKAPVSHDDLIATVEQALSVPVSGLGSAKTFRDFAPGESRERLYDFIAFRDHTAGEIAVLEYLIDGDAEDIANYHLTGNWWDVLYSVQPISDEPYP